MNQRWTILITVAIALVGTFATAFIAVWLRHTRRLELREDRKFEFELRRLENEDKPGGNVVQINTDPDQALSGNAGLGSGGYIVMDMAEKERPLFHDLLKGFEEYAKLKGYEIAFSIDSTFEGRIAFKFTVKNEGFVVGPERVKKDFAEYIDQVKNRDIDDLDNMPVITSIEEHNLAMAILKNRISFLQHSYNLSQTAVKYYENLLANVRTFPALPAPSVIVQTGGHMDQKSYSAVNSSRLIQGESNIYTDSSINIGGSLNERNERVSALEGVIAQLAAIEAPDATVTKAQKEFGKVRDELVDEATPDTSSVKKWMENAKNALKTAALGYEVTEAVHKLFTLFGVS